MMSTIDISIESLLWGLLLMAIPFYFLWKYRTGLVSSAVTGLARMVIQLFLVGLYLKYLFLWDNPILNVLWVVIMVFVATETALTRTKFKRSVMMIPILVGFATGALLVGFYFLGIVLRLDNVFSVQYWVYLWVICLAPMLLHSIHSTRICAAKIHSTTICLAMELRFPKHSRRS